MKRIFVAVFAIFLLLGMAAGLPAAQRTITTCTNAGAVVGSTGGGGGSLEPAPITYQENMPEFPQPVTGVNQNKDGAIVVDHENRMVNLGGNVYDGYGSLWYQGNSDIAYCVNGNCAFGIGLRAYFDLQFATRDSTTDSHNSADGFTFAVISAVNNDVTRTGGSPAGTSMGELMAYGGPGTTADHQGLRPPKMALEFDTYPNTGGSATNVCGAGTRMDPTVSGGFRNHIALVHWGKNSVAATCGPYNGISYAGDTFDDNQHSAGGAAAGETPPTPANSRNYVSAADTDYYEGPRAGYYNWLEDGQIHRVRIEIIRPIMPNATTGDFDYTIKAWIDCTGSCTLAKFQDVMQDYADTAPQVQKTVAFDPSYHDLYRRVFFGFTEATGANTQLATISNFRLYFPQSSCTYAINPTSISFTSAANNGTVGVTAGAGCSWNSVSNASWLHVTSPGTGTGNGSMAYTVDANTGTARQGKMIVAGRSFTVDQADGCTYAINPTSATPAGSAGTGSVSVTAGSGCTWTADVAADSPWLTVTSGATGTGNGTVSYSYTANDTAAPRIGTITIAGQTFTVTQQQPPTLYVADNSFACKPGMGSSRIYIKAYVSDGSAAGAPITDASVTYSISGGSGSGTLTNRGGGWYGGNQTSNCGLGSDCARTNRINGSRTVTITVIRAGYIGSPLTKTMTVP